MTAGAAILVATISRSALRDRSICQPSCSKPLPAIGRLAACGQGRPCSQSNSAATGIASPSNSRVKASQRASEDVATWVQCDKCDKWRSMPAGWKCRAVSSSRTLSFECAQHPIRELASCEVPEEKFQGAWSYGADELDKRAASARKQAEAEGLLLKPSPGAAAGASSTSSRFLHVQLVCGTSGGALI